jgi:hypothetical protein
VCNPKFSRPCKKSHKKSKNSARRPREQAPPTPPSDADELLPRRSKRLRLYSQQANDNNSLHDSESESTPAQKEYDLKDSDSD